MKALIRRFAALFLILLLITAPAGCSAASERSPSVPAVETPSSGKADAPAETAPSAPDALPETPAAEAPSSGNTDTPAETAPALPDPLPETSADDIGLVLLSDAVPDAIQEVRYHTTYNFVGQRIDGYEEPCILLTREAAAALKAVSDELLPLGYRLKVYDGYRPQTAVDHFVRWAEDPDAQEMKAAFYPDVEKDQLFAQGYIAALSGHSRGSTVDLTLLNALSGKEVDMGGTFDYFGERSHADFTADLTEAQIANRALLRNVMLRHGFRPLSTEWWHFTLSEEPYPNRYFDVPVSSASAVPFSAENAPLTTTD